MAPDPTGQPHQSLLRRMATNTPIIFLTYAAGSAALGFGFGSAAFDALALGATGAGFMVGERDHLSRRRPRLIEQTLANTQRLRWSCERA